jgi:DNA-binding NarL/FixJ family response regulator
MPLKTRLVIVDDHELVCDALTSLLRNDPVLEVLGSARTPDSALALTKDKRPDVVLVDLALGNVNALDHLVPKLEDVQVCVLSVHLEPYLILQAFQAGVLGYVSKAASQVELREAIHAVSRGEIFMCSHTRKVAFAVKNLIGRPAGALTNREQEVLRLAASGKSSHEIAAELGMSRRTAEAHRAKLMKKLALKSQTDLVRYAIRTGIISI